MSLWFSGLIEPSKEELQELAATSTPPVRFCGDTEEPEEVDLFPQNNTEQQAAMGSCNGASGAECGEVCNRLAGATDIEFSKLGMYLLAQKYMGGMNGDNGSHIMGFVKAAEDFGFIPETYLPYPQNMRDRHDAAREYSRGRSLLLANEQELREKASPHKTKSHTVLKGYVGIYKYLASQMGPVQIGVPWDSGTRSRGPVIETWRHTGGWHAMHFRGYSKRKDRQGRNYLLLVNTHGTGWGSNGVAEIAPSVVDYWDKFEPTIYVGVSDMTTPEPRYPDVTKWRVV